MTYYCKSIGCINPRDMKEDFCNRCLRDHDLTQTQLKIIDKQEADALREWLQLSKD